MSAVNRKALVNMPRVLYSETRLGPSRRGSLSGSITYPGGLDQVTPTLDLQPGSLRAAVNYEVATQGGYGRIVGYERFDGRPAPSSAGFVLVQLVSFVNVPTVGDTVTQAVSGAHGTVAAVSTVGLTPYMILTQVTGTFDEINLITTP